MEQLVLTLKDKSKRQFLLELLRQLDFIEVEVKEEEKQEEESYDFFQSAGLFSNRSIDANELRKQAWRLPS